MMRGRLGRAEEHLGHRKLHSWVGERFQPVETDGRSKGLKGSRVPTVTV